MNFCLLSSYNDTLCCSQLFGTVVASSTYFATAWWLLTSIKNICDTSLLPDGSPWTCPGDDVFYNASIIWGVIGPLRMFTKYGVYKEMNYFFLIGFLAPIPGWYLSRKYPNIKWLKLIHMPIIIGATSGMPPTKAVNYWAWGTKPWTRPWVKWPNHLLHDGLRVPAFLGDLTSQLSLFIMAAQIQWSM